MGSRSTKRTTPPLSKTTTRAFSGGLVGNPKRFGVRGNKGTATIHKQRSEISGLDEGRLESRYGRRAMGKAP